MARKTSIERIARYTALRDGVKAAADDELPPTVGAVPFTRQAIVDFLQSVLDSFKATDAAHTGWVAQLARHRALERRAVSFARYLEMWVRARNETDAVALGRYGLEPAKKPGPKTVAVKAASAAKSRATRATRARPKKKRRR